MTQNDLRLSFYLTDWAPENFAVMPDSLKVSNIFPPILLISSYYFILQVSLIDLEHLIVVNTSRLEEEGAAAHISDNWGSR